MYPSMNSYNFDLSKGRRVFIHFLSESFNFTKINFYCKSYHETLAPLLHWYYFFWTFCLRWKVIYELSLSYLHILNSLSYLNFKFSFMNSSLCCLHLLVKPLILRKYWHYNCLFETLISIFQLFSYYSLNCELLHS